MAAPMMADVSPRARPIYHSPTSGGRGRPRQGSMQRSTYPAPLPPTVESERTAIPRDADTLSLKPEYLPRWFPPERLWPQLPGNLQAAILHMQKAGAAALTSYERLEQYSGAIDIGPNSEAPEDELLVQLDDSVSSLNIAYRPRLRTESSTGSSVVISSPSSSSHSPRWDAASHAMAPVSPMCLAADAQFTSNRPRERSFSVPMEPHNAKYATELSYLRTEVVPCLRHAARAVDTEWSQIRFNGVINSPDVKAEFENWWAVKKCAIMTLDEKAQRLSHAIGLGPNGMGWTAP